jgi:hypothetical protein
VIPNRMRDEEVAHARRLALGRRFDHYPWCEEDPAACRSPLTERSEYPLARLHARRTLPGSRIRSEGSGTSPGEPSAGSSCARKKMNGDDGD